MLNLKNVKIVINFIAKTDNINLNSLIKTPNLFEKFCIEYFNLDDSNIKYIIKNNLGYKIGLKVNDKLIPTIMINEYKSLQLSTFLAFYVGEIVNFKFELHFDDIGVKQLNILINQLISDKIICFDDTEITLQEYCSKIFNILLQQNVENNKLNSLNFLEVFSIINPDSFDQIIEYDKLYDNEYEIELYEAAIRRMPDMKEARLDITRNEQLNLSLYKGDLIFLNYHNTFIFVDKGKKHINPDFYIELNIQYKLYLTNLIYIQTLIDEKFSAFNNVPNKLKELRNASDWLDSIRFKYVILKEKFEKIIDIAALRVSLFNKTANTKYGIKNKEEKIENYLAQFESLISRRLALLQERHLQNIALGLTILSIVIAILSIFISLK